VRNNKIEAALQAGRVPIGMQSFSGCAALIEIIGLSGFDFVMIDTEHACIGPETVEQLVRAADSVDLMPLVRVEENAETPIRKALEAGAAGVIVPRVNSAADVEAALAAAHYPPAGRRGMCPSTRAARYSIDGWDTFTRWTNTEALVVPLIETPHAIEDADAICALPGVEIVFFGPGDLGMALGVGAGGMGTPEVQEAFATLREAARAHGTHLMTVPFPDLSVESCRQLIESGVTVLMHSIDELLFGQLCRQIITDLSALRSASPVTQGAAVRAGADGGQT
jgi:2-keto-3-deoxy-L-rhamnonate aldolase RhmA